MKTNPASQSGFFKGRALVAIALCSASVLLGALSFASSPSAGTLTDASGPISYTAGPFFIANQTPLPFVDQGPECDNPFQPCDDYILTVTLPAGYSAAHPNAAVKVSAGWADTGANQSDYDLYVYNNPDSDCDPTDCSFTSGGEEPPYNGAGGNNPEVAIVSPLQDGTHQYTVKVVPFSPTGETVNVTAELLPGDPNAPDPNFGGPDASAPGVPRYQNFYAPSGSSAETSSGEFNIGFNPKSGRIMAMNSGPIWRITPPEILSPAQPECCEGLWEDVTNLSTITGLDPILFTDQKTGRTFASNSTAGANAVYGFSDNDGDVWAPLSASPASGGTDHETIGSGPYPAAVSAALSNAVNQGEAVYYCSQSWPLGPATCQRSDNLGASYGPGVFAYEGNGITQCSGLHGHVHVAPDGTAWVPVRDCSGIQGGAYSTDAGVTWHEFTVPGSVPQGAGADPSIAIDSDNTAYYCYVNNEPVPTGYAPEGHVHVKVSHDRGATWTDDFDLGASHGIKNAVHPEAIGGTSGRAACGFIGTNVPGDYQAIGFPGKWYAFIATTYDGGKSWTTVNATPNDPVQSHTGVWQQGGSHDQRNLLDFNEITTDAKGRVLYGYSDGCVTPQCIAGTAGDDFVAHMRVARQTGGMSLFSSNDANTDTTTALAPKPPCLSGTRDPNASHLRWKAPDNGGADIVNYLIYRGTTPGGEGATPIGQTGNARTTFDDTTADPTVTHYYYKVSAVNAVGTSARSNEIDLIPIDPPPPETRCQPPYLTVTGPGHAGTVPTDPTSGELTIESVHMGEPFTSCTDKSLTVLMKVQTLDPNGTGTAVLPPNSEWQILFNVQGTTTDASKTPVAETVFVELDTFTSPALPRLSIGRRDPTATGTQDTRVCTSDATTSCPAISVSYNRDGTIQFKLDVSTPLVFPAPAAPATGVEFAWNGSNPGTQLTAIGGNTYVLAGATRGFLETVQTSGGTGSYVTAGNTACTGVPFAGLLASPTNGFVPLAVNFNASSSINPNPCTTISSYTFNFGDGSAPVTQPGATVAHTYNNAGHYTASVVVTDSKGTSSTNPAQVTITANPTPTPTPTPTPKPTATPTPTPRPTATPTPTPMPKPDLVVSKLTAANNQTKQGGKIPITATIRNQGNANAGASATRFVLDGTTILGNVATPPLNAGASANVTLNWDTANVKKGDHTIRAAADINKQVAESNETNNARTITVTIQGNQTGR